MKKQILLLTFSSAMLFAFGQTKQSTPQKPPAAKTIVIPVNDIRNQGVTSANKSADGHKAGDVNVVRFMEVVASQTPDKIDTASMYEIYFYKTYHSVTEKGKSWLQAYYLGIRDDEDFDKASYIWQPKNILSITLINSSKNIKKSIKLTPNGQSVAVVKEEVKQ